ncbi:MAG: 3-deoxy-D-manno-octulosonic acid transferase [Opitutales bacterium]
MWLWLYRLLFLPALVLSLPVFLTRMLRRGGLRVDAGQRFGRWTPLPAPRPGRPRVWIQAVSVGEILALRPILLAWQEATPAPEIVLSCTTTTGRAIIREQLLPAGLVQHTGYFPLDFTVWSRRTWAAIRPDLVVSMESELWPEHLHQARQRGIPVLLINARLSERSFRRYRIAGAATRWLFGYLDRICAGSAIDAERFRALGVPPSRIEVTGNLKADVPAPPVLSPEERASLRRELGFIPEQPVLLGASTWPGEEAALLDALDAAEAAGHALQLLLVPRHQERGDELADWLAGRATDRPWHRRSSGKTAPAGTRIYLADTTGELARLTQAADIAFIGKTLPPRHEGQTPIEAAALGVPLITGPRLSNFHQIHRGLIRAGACRAVSDAGGLTTAVLALLNDPEERTVMGRAGRDWHRANRGSAQRTVVRLNASLGAIPRR